MWEFLDGVRERLIRDGKRVESKEEHPARSLTPAAQAFLDRGYALLRAAGAVARQGGSAVTRSTRKRKAR